MLEGCCAAAECHCTAVVHLAVEQREGLLFHGEGLLHSRGGRLYGSGGLLCSKRADHQPAQPSANLRTSQPDHWGNVCSVRARRATFLLTIPTSALDLPSHGEAPQVDHVALHTFPTKHVA